MIKSIAELENKKYQKEAEGTVAPSSPVPTTPAPVAGATDGTPTESKPSFTKDETVKVKAWAGSTKDVIGKTGKVLEVSPDGKVKVEVALGGSKKTILSKPENLEAVKMEETTPASVPSMNGTVGSKADQKAGGAVITPAISKQTEAKKCDCGKKDCEVCGKKEVKEEAKTSTDMPKGVKDQTEAKKDEKDEKKELEEAKKKVEDDKKIEEAKKKEEDEKKVKEEAKKPETKLESLLRSAMKQSNFIKKESFLKEGK